MMSLFLYLAAVRAIASGSLQEHPAPRVPDEISAALAEAGLWIDLERGVLAVPVEVQIREDLLEYLLVGPGGAAHESLFLTQVKPSLVNAALLLLGAEPGHNAHFEERESSPDGEPRREVQPPAGDGFYLYAAWREGEETYFFRVEDLIANLATGRTLRRHRWVYLGSRFAQLEPGQPERFLADLEGNLVNLSFFYQGNTLLTAALDECVEQTIWAANAWLVTPRGEPVCLFFARQALASLDPAWVAKLPVARSVPADEAGGGEPR